LKGIIGLNYDISEMEIGSENNPTIGFRNSYQDGNGPKGKMHQQTNVKIEK
jgi:hypothetical protein